MLQNKYTRLVIIGALKKSSLDLCIISSILFAVVSKHYTSVELISPFDSWSKMSHTEVHF